MSESAPTFLPGAVVTLNFPALGDMQDNLPAACEVSTPKTYDPSRLVPHLVCFGVGKGSRRVDGAAGLVDFDRVVVAALPYPGGQIPRLAA